MMAGSVPVLCLCDIMHSLRKDPLKQSACVIFQMEKVFSNTVSQEVDMHSLSLTRCGALGLQCPLCSQRPGL